MIKEDKIQILVIGEGNAFGKGLARFLSKGRMYAVNCSCTPDAMRDAFSAQKYDAVFITANPLDEKRTGIIKNIHAKYPWSKLIVGGYSGSEYKLCEYIDAGADIVLSLPTDPKKIAVSIDYLLMYEGDDHETALFLMDLGLKKFSRGFSYLARGVRLAIDHPEYLDDMMKLFYPAVGEPWGANAASVEKLIRQTFEHFQDNKYFRSFRPKGEKGFTNTEFFNILSGLYRGVMHTECLH